MKPQLAIKISWLILRCRPFFKCPLCNGAGGAMEGYYEPEWSECKCYHYWEPLEDWGFTWFVGRLPLLSLLRAKLSRRLLKIETIMPLRYVAGCWIGLHRWMPREHQIERNQRICGVCFRSDKRRG